MVQGEKTSSYDAIIATDVFVYLGRLDEIVREVKRVLRPGGLFAFSVEDLVVSRNAGAGQGAHREYQLENTGRYSHSGEYLGRLATVNGFLIIESVAVQLRLEKGEPLGGRLMLWRS